MAVVDVFAPTLNVLRVLGYELEIIKITNLLFRFQLYIPSLLYLIKKNLLGYPTWMQICVLPREGGRIRRALWFSECFFAQLHIDKITGTAEEVGTMFHLFQGVQRREEGRSLVMDQNKVGIKMWQCEPRRVRSVENITGIVFTSFPLKSPSRPL